MLFYANSSTNSTVEFDLTDGKETIILYWFSIYAFKSLEWDCAECSLLIFVSQIMGKLLSLKLVYLQRKIISTFWSKCNQSAQNSPFGVFSHWICLFYEIFHFIFYFGSKCQ
jgi:hypothetical protein